MTNGGDMSETVTLKILPNWFEGHTYIWDVASDFVEPLPWKFTLQTADCGTSLEWSDVSPELVNQFVHYAEYRAKYNKNYNENYRVKLVSGTGRTYYSKPRTVFADICKDDFFMIREIQRNEYQGMRVLSGVPCYLWQRKQTGIKCQYCRDAATGEVVNPDCAWCMGVGVIGGYHGPYKAWGVFNTTPSKTSYGETEIGVTTSNKNTTVRLLGNPDLNQKDIIEDITTRRMYTVDSFTPIMEIRRIPVVQQVAVSERQATDIAHKLGTDTALGESPCGI